MNYSESLQKIELFMKRSGIRFFCSNYCKHCCGSCDRHGKNMCYDGGNRNIGCSAYICSHLRELFSDCKGMENYSNIEKEISSQCYFYKDLTTLDKNKIKYKKDIVNLIDLIDSSKIKNILYRIQEIFILCDKKTMISV